MTPIPPDWTMVLNKPGAFTKAEVTWATEWETCAIGEAVHRFPSIVEIHSGLSNAPWDNTLYRLGMDFGNAVEFQERPRARTLYKLIQRRITALRKHA